VVGLQLGVKRSGVQISPARLEKSRWEGVRRAPPLPRSSSTRCGCRNNFSRLMDSLIEAAGVLRITPTALRHIAQSVGRVVVGDDKGDAGAPRPRRHRHHPGHLHQHRHRTAPGSRGPRTDEAIALSPCGSGGSQRPTTASFWCGATSWWPRRFGATPLALGCRPHRVSKRSGARRVPGRAPVGLVGGRRRTRPSRRRAWPEWPRERHLPAPMPRARRRVGADIGALVLRYPAGETVSPNGNSGAMRHPTECRGHIIVA
jgi:hypothetical protein